jgi:hypothetical protein
MASPPVGWSAYNYFTNMSMLVYQQVGGGGGIVGSGGDNFIYGWTSTVDVVPGGGTHTHTYSGQSSTYIGEDNDWGSLEPSIASFETHRHTYSGTTTISYSTHVHEVTQDTFFPKYQTVIAGIKTG